MAYVQRPDLTLNIIPAEASATPPSSAFIILPHPITTPPDLIFVSKNLEKDEVNVLQYSLKKQARKEELFITAIRNLRKKINFHDLNNDYQNDDITEEEYDKEIRENPKKYIVEVAALKDKTDYEILLEIIPKISDDFSVDDIADIFSIDLQTRSLK